MFFSSINFARIGFELSTALFEAAISIAHQHNVTLGDNTCVQGYFLSFYIFHKAAFSTKYLSISIRRQIHDQSIPLAAKQQLSNSIAAGHFTARAFTEFVRLVDGNHGIADYRLPDQVTFDLFGFRKPQRQAGLRLYDDGQLFGLSFMQRHCGYSDDIAYATYKPFIEHALTQREM